MQLSKNVCGIKILRWKHRNLLFSVRIFRNKAINSYSIVNRDIKQSEHTKQIHQYSFNKLGSQKFTDSFKITNCRR